MYNNNVLKQRQATKRIVLKRYKRLGLNHALKYINKLAKEFSYNNEYYRALEKGLIKLNKKVVE